MIGLRHFEPREFGLWWPWMDPGLLESLDEFRDRLGRKVMISKAIGALGRRLGESALSRHNVDRWKRVMAADVMLPEGPDITDPTEGRRLVRLAEEAGFGAIGFYPEWRPYPGLHLDVRPKKEDGSLAMWSRIGGKYLALEAAFTNEDETLA